MNALRVRSWELRVGEGARKRLRVLLIVAGGRIGAQLSQITATNVQLSSVDCRRNAAERTRGGKSAGSEAVAEVSSTRVIGVCGQFTRQEDSVFILACSVRLDDEASLEIPRLLLRNNDLFPALRASSRC